MPWSRGSTDSRHHSPISGLIPATGEPSSAYSVRLLGDALNVQESQWCRIEALAQRRSHLLHQLVSQLVILFAFSTQALPSSAIARVIVTARASNRQR